MKHVLSWRWGDVRCQTLVSSKLRAELIGSLLAEGAKATDVVVARTERRKKKHGGKRPGPRKGRPLSAGGSFVRRKARTASYGPTGESFEEDDIVITASGKRIAEVLVHEPVHGWATFLEPGQEIEPVVCANPYWEE
jgi:hypothetical protein